MTELWVLNLKKEKKMNNTPYHPVKNNKHPQAIARDKFENATCYYPVRFLCQLYPWNKLELRVVVHILMFVNNSKLEIQHANGSASIKQP
jgi:hypothetical protein